MECEARDGVHEHSFPECRPRPGPTELVERGFVGHEGQGYEFRKPTCALLQIAYGQQVPRPRAIVVDVSEHDGSGCAQAHVMSRLYDLEPLTRVEFVRAKHLPDSVIKDLGRRTR